MRSFSPEEHLAFRRSEERLPEAEEALYEILVPENEKKAISPDDFADENSYGREAVERDKKSVAELEKKFAADPSMEASRKFGKLFEALVNYQINKSDLMGPNAEAIVPARYDDIFNKIDSIVEFDEEGATSYLALAIDVTRSSKEIATKFEAIRSRIQQGKLSQVKYFKTKNYRGELSSVARVVVGADHGTVEDISNTLLRFMRMQKEIAASRKAPGRFPTADNVSKEISLVRETLAAHPLQRIVLKEIHAQLEAFKAYSQELGKNEAAEQYGRILSVIDEIIEAKNLGSEEPNAENVPQDKVYDMILQETQRFGSDQS